MNCNCQICIESKDIDDMIHLKDVDRLCKKVEELYNRILNIDSDKEYYECILNGSWPRSIEILERCLERAKEKQK